MDEFVDPPISQWLSELKRGEEQSAGKLWEQYFARLVRMASRKLGGTSKRVADEEDVVVSAFDSLYRGAAAGRFSQVTDRDELWRLLVTITAQKSVDLIRKVNSKKRGGGTVRGDSVFRSKGNQSGDMSFDRVAGQDPSPQFIAMLNEQYDVLLSSLRDDTLRRIAILRMEGYANEEIAENVGISLRSVERKLKLIRDEWSEDLGVE